MLKKKLIIILGPTSSGKSDLAVKLAKKFNGEIVSADSRQVYKGMNIGTGKITKKEMKGIPHYLLSVASPKKRFTIVQYQKLALATINRIYRKGKIPILCGGTGFYIDAILGKITIPEVSPDWKLRKQLSKKTAQELFQMLKRLDLKRATAIDPNNPRRLIRAIEIIIKTGKPVPRTNIKQTKFDALIIGIKKNPDELKKLINQRLNKRLKKGLVKEVEMLRKRGVSWKRLDEFGLDYRWVAKFLQKKISYKEMIEKMLKENEHYSKRQMTWFKRDKRIYWIKNYKEAEILLKKLWSAC